MIFAALSNAVYRVSLHGPGAELGGGVRSPGRRVRRRAPARVSLTVPLALTVVETTSLRVMYKTINKTFLAMRYAGLLSINAS